MPEEVPEDTTPWLLALETSIVDRLKLGMGSIPVEATPEKEWKFLHPSATLLVAFNDIKPGALLDASTSIQEMTLAYEVVVMSRSLRNHTGLYILIIQVLNSLLGWKPPMGSPFTLARAKYVGENDGAWAWSLVFETEHVLVPGLDLTEVAPPMTTIEFKHCREDCECRN
jgi:hypothetical protein